MITEYIDGSREDYERSIHYRAQMDRQRKIDAVNEQKKNLGNQYGKIKFSTSALTQIGACRIDRRVVFGGHITIIIYQLCWSNRRIWQQFRWTEIP